MLDESLNALCQIVAAFCAIQIVSFKINHLEKHEK